MLRNELGMRFVLAGMVAGVVSLVGCGGSTGTPVGCTSSCGGGGGGSSSYTGVVHAGTQPVAGATIQMYAVGSTGNASAATPMLTKSITTNSGGQFTLTGAYACGQSSTGAAINSPSNQVYLVATGGSVGSGSANSQLVLMAALGTCSSVSALSTIAVNEVTTAASAWALAQFMSSATNVGGSATNALGLENAFLDAGLLASLTTGNAATLGAGLSIESGKLYSLANALSSCAVSSGGTGCGPLFAAATPAGGSAPGNTLAAALNIVKHPGQNVTPVYQVSVGTQSFSGGLSAAPSDWTLSLTVTGGGLNSPTQLGVDSGGNVFVADYPGGVSGFSPQGAPLTGTPWGAGTISENYGLTIDSYNNIWVSNEQTPTKSGSISGLYGTTSGKVLGTIIQNAGTGSYAYDSTILYPVALAADTAGNVLIANFNGSEAAEYNNGVFVNGSLGYGYSAEPEAVSGDGTGGLWLADEGSNLVTHVGANGRVVSNPSCCSRADGIATDAQGNAWVANYGNSTVSEISPLCDSTGVSANAACMVANNVVTLSNVTGGGLSYPGQLSVDAGQNIWVVNVYTPGQTQGSFTEIAGNAGTLAAGTPISPATGYGLDVPIVQPYQIVPDASGNLWLSNQAKNNLLMYFGLATPTATPARPYPAAP